MICFGLLFGEGTLPRSYDAKEWKVWSQTGLVTQIVLPVNDDHLFLSTVKYLLILRNIY